MMHGVSSRNFGGASRGSRDSGWKVRGLGIRLRVSAPTGGFRLWGLGLGLRLRV